ncbi:hypothetical protein T440DRAFT_145497 [Plenodomus tracheiphilus IPT5]|uniref:Uncharacterized protein n=1 Tax=Plenodomus tracheiphilus IPT5 TaxID=1408161 RepID=A0A6A7B331_9PLEO|nr:hypothetical protein T440DRAFT_145497 [Plenodomus tracheiphilus IPT5]
MKLARHGGSATSLLKDVLVELRKSPENEHARLCSTFVEDKNEHFLLMIELILVSDEHDRLLLACSLTWTWWFDANHGFTLPLHDDLRVYCATYFPSYPRHAVLEDGSIPKYEPYPKNSPREVLARLHTDSGMWFLEVPGRYYCGKQSLGDKTFWRVLTIANYCVSRCGRTELFRHCSKATEVAGDKKTHGLSIANCEIGGLFFHRFDIDRRS